MRGWQSSLLFGMTAWCSISRLSLTCPQLEVRQQPFPENMFVRCDWKQFSTCIKVIIKHEQCALMLFKWMTHSMPRGVFSSVLWQTKHNNWSKKKLMKRVPRGYSDYHSVWNIFYGVTSIIYLVKEGGVQSSPTRLHWNSWHKISDGLVSSFLLRAVI